MQTPTQTEGIEISSVNCRKTKVVVLGARKMENEIGSERPAFGMRNPEIYTNLCRGLATRRTAENQGQGSGTAQADEFSGGNNLRGRG